MNNISIKELNEARDKFETYCKEHGLIGKVQVQLETDYLLKKRAVDIRCHKIANEIKDKNVIVWNNSDNFLSHAAGNIAMNNAMKIVLETFDAVDNNDLRAYNIALNKAKDNNNINLKALIEVVNLNNDFTQQAFDEILEENKELLIRLKNI